MLKHIFYQKYANMPIKKRTQLLDVVKDWHVKTVQDIYVEIKALDDAIRPAVIRIDDLLRLADKIFKIYE